MPELSVAINHNLSFGLTHSFYCIKVHYFWFLFCMLYILENLRHWNNLKLLNYIMICSICIILLLLFICEWFLHLASVILQVLDAFCSSLEINKIRNFAQFNIILSFGGSYFFYKYISQLCFFLISVQLASSLGPRFYANIFKCKHISETGAQQVVMICKLHLCSFQIKHVSIREAALMHDITIILKGILIYI